VSVRNRAKITARDDHEDMQEMRRVSVIESTNFFHVSLRRTRQIAYPENS